jgi:hypothetical protein
MATTMTKTSRWPCGTGQWNNTKVVIVARDARTRDHLVRSWSEQFDVGIALTPLELIQTLETEGLRISTVVIADVAGSAEAPELASFLDEYYPWLRVITEATSSATATEAFPEREQQSHAAS